VALAVPNTLGFLLGSWSIERMICDHRDGLETRFGGSAVVQAGDSGATYTEQGEVSHGAYSGSARRRLWFAELADRTVRIDFRDGRPFLVLDLGTGVHRAVHRCGADIYELSFEVLDADRISEQWRVSGPAKDYVAETVWQRR
jgi:hypothetical protein